MKIRIKRRNRYFKVKNIIMILCLITISLMSGIIGAEFVINKYLSTSLGYTTPNEDYNSTQNTKNSYVNVINKISDSIVTVASDSNNLRENKYAEGNATGVIVDSNGYILTSLSKVRNNKKTYVKLSSKGSPVYKAEVIEEDEELGIAVLRINCENLSPILISDKSSLKVGSSVFIPGNATASDTIGVCTNGIITTVSNERVKDSDKISVIETNAIINEFNDGAPICDMNGKLVGFASEVLSKKYNKSNLYYGVGNVNIKKMIGNLVGFQTMIGITGKEMDISSEEGLYIETVVPKGYASDAGIKSGDILLKIDGNSIRSNDDVYNIIKGKRNGDSAICDILRDGKQIKITINF